MQSILGVDPGGVVELCVLLLLLQLPLQLLDTQNVRHLPSAGR